MIRLAIIAAAMTITACGPQPNIAMTEQAGNATPPEINTSGRFNVERVGVFRDDLSYDGRRGIYIMTDTKTGKEFVGVSGIGISELGSHPAGKVRVSDER